VSPRTGATLLKGAGYSLQANRKTREGTSHPDRDAQFRYLNAAITDCHQHDQPAISVDTKKKELVGDFKNGGRTWRPHGQRAKVRVHDFLDPVLGKAIPYGVYDLANNEGWVSVGIDHDTVEATGPRPRGPAYGSRPPSTRAATTPPSKCPTRSLPGSRSRRTHSTATGTTPSRRAAEM
jgi:hypothetical protein